MGKQFVLTLFKWVLSGKPRNFATNSMARLGQSLFLLLCVLGWASAAHAAIPASQRAVLTAFYTSTNGASWTNNTNWNGAVGTECTWFGITCDSSQSNIITLGLSGNNLVGALPSISGLTALLDFRVHNNQLTGPVPATPPSLVAGLSNLCSNSLVSSGKTR